MSETTTDRRTERRMRASRPCKIFEPRSGKYFPGGTVDLSEHGMLVRINRPLALKPGDRVRVGVAMLERQGLIHAKEMIESIIVRSMCSTDDVTTIAVRFADEVEETEPIRIAA